MSGDSGSKEQHPALAPTVQGSTLQDEIRSQTGSDSTQPRRIDRFVILRKLGEGGMGVVYAAYDNQLDRKVAIKVVRGQRQRSPQARARMLREAQSMARLSHPNVVHVYEVGDYQGQVFVAMEYIEGHNLRHWCTQSERSKIIRSLVILTSISVSPW